MQVEPRDTTHQRIKGAADAAMTQPTTHPIPTATSPVSPTAPAVVEARRPTRTRATCRGSRVQRIARWLAVGASAVALLRGLVELLAAWRAL